MDDRQNRPGFPIQKSQDRSLFASSPGLFAGYHVFHRLLTPRHPPCALSSLIIPTCDRPDIIISFRQRQRRLSLKSSRSAVHDINTATLQAGGQALRHLSLGATLSRLQQFVRPIHLSKSTPSHRRAPHHHGSGRRQRWRAGGRLTQGEPGTVVSWHRLSSRPGRPRQFFYGCRRPEVRRAPQAGGRCEAVEVYRAPGRCQPRPRGREAATGSPFIRPPSAEVRRSARPGGAGPVHRGYHEPQPPPGSRRADPSPACPAGGVAERLKAPVLKTGEGLCLSVGSNPTPTASLARLTSAKPRLVQAFRLPHRRQPRPLRLRFHPVATRPDPTFPAHFQSVEQSAQSRRRCRPSCRRCRS